MKDHRDQTLSVGAQQLNSIEVSFIVATTLKTFCDVPAHWIDWPPKHKFPDENFCSQSMPRVRAGGALGRPCWASSAQLPNKRDSEHFAQGIISPPDITGLAEEVCLACMP
eukprot:1152094-Pelagomonas_calceolata.AAC.5